MQQKNPSFENKKLQPDTGEQFFHENFPGQLKFSVASVDCQHTLWNVPTAKNGLLGEVNIISDTYVAKHWSTIIFNRKNRNQIEKYVGGSFSFLKLPEGKSVVLNNDTVMNGNHAVPQLYQNKNKIITRINALDMQNTYCKCEGAAVWFTVHNHLQENVIIASNDTDALLYYMIAANKRDRVSNEFSHEFWLEILSTSNATGLPD